MTATKEPMTTEELIQENKRLREELAASNKALGEAASNRSLIDTALSTPGATIRLGQYAVEADELETVLADGPKAVADLPKSLQEPKFLAAMMRNGRIEVGRPSHHYASDGEKDIIKMDRAPIRWTALGKGSKSMYELLAEEKGIDPRIRLHVRLTAMADVA